MSKAQHSPCQWMLKIFFTKHNWQDKQQKSWVIAPWWFGVSPWRICITCAWPSGSQKLPAPFSRWERHLHFASIRLCLALLFIISMLSSSEDSCALFWKKWIAVTPLLLLFEISVLPVEMELESWSWSYLCAIQICDSEM